MTFWSKKAAQGALVAAAGLLGAFWSAPAQAQGAWCVEIPLYRANPIMRCGFVAFEHCAREALADRGSCKPDPRAVTGYYEHPYGYERPHRYHRPYRSGPKKYRKHRR